MSRQQFILRAHAAGSSIDDISESFKARFGQVISQAGIRYIIEEYGQAMPIYEDDFDSHPLPPPGPAHPASSTQSDQTTERTMADQTIHPDSSGLTISQITQPLQTIQQPTQPSAGQSMSPSFPGEEADPSLATPAAQTSMLRHPSSATQSSGQNQSSQTSSPEATAEQASFNPRPHPFLNRPSMPYNDAARAQNPPVQASPISQPIRTGFLGDPIQPAPVGGPPSTMHPPESHLAGRRPVIHPRLLQLGARPALRDEVRPAGNTPGGLSIGSAFPGSAMTGSLVPPSVTPTGTDHDTQITDNDTQTVANQSIHPSVLDARSQIAQTPRRQSPAQTSLSGKAHRVGIPPRETDHDNEMPDRDTHVPNTQRAPPTSQTMGFPDRPLRAAPSPPPAEQIMEPPPRSLPAPRRLLAQPTPQARLAMAPPPRPPQPQSTPNRPLPITPRQPYSPPLGVGFYNNRPFMTGSTNQAWQPVASPHYHPLHAELTNPREFDSVRLPMSQRGGRTTMAWEGEDDTLMSEEELFGRTFPPVGGAMAPWIEAPPAIQTPEAYVAWGEVAASSASAPGFQAKANPTSQGPIRRDIFFTEVDTGVPLVFGL